MGTTEQDLRRWWFAVFGIVSVVLVAAGAIAWSLIHELRGSYEHALYERAEQLRNADALGIAVFKRSASSRGYLLSGDRSFLEARAAAQADVDSRLADLLANARGEVLDAAREVQQLLARIADATDRAIAAYAESPDRAGDLWDEHARPLQAALQSRIQTILDRQRAAFEAARSAADTASAHAHRLLIAMLAAIAVVIATLVYAYARAIRSLVSKLEEEQQQVTFRVIEQVPVGIFVAKPDGKPYYVNRHAQKLLGRGVEQAAGHIATTYQVFEAGSDRAYPEARLPITRALAGEMAEVTDIEVRRDGEVIPLHVVGAPVYDARGKLLYAVSGFQDVRELQRHANRDVLTGLANRAALQQMFTREALSARRTKRPLAVGIIDLDHFKSINDTHGHAKGDEVLARVARVLGETLRRTDLVGRWGGEEMVAVMPDTDLASARLALERCLVATRALDLRGKGDQPFVVTFSAGAVLVQDDEKLEAAVTRADQLLYAAKEAGRDRIVV